MVFHLGAGALWKSPAEICRAFYVFFGGASALKGWNFKGVDNE